MKKKLFILITSVLIVTVAVFAIVFYPTLNLYFAAFQSGKKVVETQASDCETTLEFVTDNSAPAPTTIPKDPEKGGKGTSYLVEGGSGGSLKYTIDDVIFYDNFSVSGIDPEDCTDILSFKEELDTEPFMLATFTVENIDAEPFYTEEEGDAFLLDVRSYIYDEYDDKIKDFGCHYIYFSEHPPQTEKSKNYSCFWLPKGEKIEFEVGFIIEKDIYDAKAGYLYVNSNPYSEDIFDPFHPSFDK